MNKYEEFEAAAAEGKAGAQEILDAFRQYRAGRAVAGLETDNEDITKMSAAEFKKAAAEYFYISVNKDTKKASASAEDAERARCFRELQTACASTGKDAPALAMYEHLTNAQILQASKAIASRGKKTVGNCQTAGASRKYRDNLDEYQRRGLK